MLAQQVAHKAPVLVTEVPQTRQRGGSSTSSTAVAELWVTLISVPCTVPIDSGKFIQAN